MCQQCKEIEDAFHDICISRTTEYSSHVDTRLVKSLYKGILEHDCILCQLFTKLLEAEIKQYPGDWPWSLNIEPYDLSQSKNPGAAFAIMISPRVLWSLGPKDGAPSVVNTAAMSVTLDLDLDLKTWMRRSELCLNSRVGLLLPTAAVDSNPEVWLGYAIERDLVNYKIVRQWLDECQTLHASCQSQADHHIEPRDLQVIDCETRKIVPCPKGSPYLALSYVWGHERRKEGLTRGLLPSTLVKEYFPRTVKDAIFVTLSLGYKYLWVDRYCIDQEDQAHKTRQLAAMGKVYGGAVVTIVAASGDGDESGLAGAGTLPPILRDEQPKAYIGGHQLVWTLPGLSQIIRDTKWVTRGWTYQEEKLSTRCLFFTKSQVFLKCQTRTCCEAICHMAHIQPSDTRDSDTDGNNDHVETAIVNSKASHGAFDKDVAVDNGPPDFHQCATEYLKRSFTYDSDAVDAFLGILSRMGLDSYCGVPLIFGPCCKRGDKDVLGETSTALSAFIRGLTWTVVMPSKHRRRTAMPSWSWLCLKNQYIHFNQYPNTCQSRDGSMFSFAAWNLGVNVWCRNKFDTEWEPFETVASRQTMPIPFSSPQILLQTRVGQVSRYKWTECIWREDVVYIDELPEHCGLSIMFDRVDQTIQQEKEGEYQGDMKWKLAFLNTWGLLDKLSPEQEIGVEHPGHGDQELFDYRYSKLLLLESAGGDTWRRIGVTDDNDHSMKQNDLEKLPLEKLVII